MVGVPPDVNGADPLHNLEVQATRAADVSMNEGRSPAFLIEQVRVQDEPCIPESFYLRGLGTEEVGQPTGGVFTGPHGCYRLRTRTTS